MQENLTFTNIYNEAYIHRYCTLCPPLFSSFCCLLLCPPAAPSAPAPVMPASPCLAPENVVHANQAEYSGTMI